MKKRNTELKKPVLDNVRNLLDEITRLRDHVEFLERENQNTKERVAVPADFDRALELALRRERLLHSVVEHLLKK